MKAKTKQVQGCWHRAQLVCVPSMQEALPDDWMRDEREAVDGLVFPAEAAQVDDGTGWEWRMCGPMYSNLEVSNGSSGDAQ